jgi:ribose transport system substrate-binding protein
MKTCMQKRTLLALMSLVLMLSMVVTGCAPTSTTTPTTPPTTVETLPIAETKTYTIGLSDFSLGNSWRVQMVAEAKYAADNNPLVKKLIVTEADGSVEKQIADIEDLITKKVDAILITAINPDALVPVVDKAMEAGIVVVDFDNLIDTNNITAHIMVDQKDFGKIQATWLVGAIGGKGEIVAFNGMNGTQISADRFAGAKAVFDQYPDIKIVNTVYADWDYAKAKTAMESLMTTYPNISGVWSQGGAMSQAVIQAYLEKQLTPPPVTGEDGNGFLKLWKTLREGDYPNYDSIATSMPTWVSAQAMEVALKVLTGETVEKEILLPIPTITSATLDQYVRPALSDSFWCNSRLPDDVVMKLFPK